MLNIEVTDNTVPLGLVRTVRRVIADAKNARLDAEAQLEYVKRELPKVLNQAHYFVYAGGNHVTVHHETGEASKGARLLFITKLAAAGIA
jgi:molybdopterin synthase catalytic subunit